MTGKCPVHTVGLTAGLCIHPSSQPQDPDDPANHHGASHTAVCVVGATRTPVHASDTGVLAMDGFPPTLLYENVSSLMQDPHHMKTLLSPYFYP